jgi:Arc/MetJ-type ribon-helix-helix transcriptional regulator
LRPKGKKEVDVMHLTVRIPNSIIERLDLYVDEIRYRSRAHLITVILMEWLESEVKHAKDNRRVDRPRRSANKKSAGENRKTIQARKN